MKRVLLCKLNLPVQWVYDVLDFLLFFPLRVEHYKFARFHTNYEQNPIKASICTYIRLNFYLEKEKSYESIKTYSKL
jgi:hypothetical protein